MINAFTLKSTCYYIISHRLVFRMTAGMDNPIHVQVQVVKLHIIRIRLTTVHWHPHTVHFTRLQWSYKLRQSVVVPTACTESSLFWHQSNFCVFLSLEHVKHVK